MTTINDLSSTDTLFSVDLLPVWRTANSDTRKASMATLQAYMQDNLDFSTAETASGIIYASDYVTVGSTEDQSTQMQAALSAAAGGTLMLPEGTIYCKNLSRPPNTAIIGVEREASVLKLPAASNTYIIADECYVNNTTGGQYGGYDNKYTFDGNVANQTVAKPLQIVRAYAHHCEEVGYILSKGYGVLLTEKSANGTSMTTGSLANCTWRSCTFDGNALEGWYGENGSFNRLADFEIVGCNFNANGGTTRYNCYAERAAGAKFTGNQCYTGGIGEANFQSAGGLIVQGNNFEITRTAITSGTVTGLIIGAGGYGFNVVNANVFWNDTASAGAVTYKHMDLSSGGANTIIAVTGNAFWSNNFTINAWTHTGSGYSTDAGNAYYQSTQPSPSATVRRSLESNSSGTWTIGQAVAINAALSTTADITQSLAGGGFIQSSVAGEGTTQRIAVRYSADVSPPLSLVYKARGTIASPGNVVQFDEVGRRGWFARASGTFNECARDTVFIRTASPSSTDMAAGRYTFLCPDASATMTEFMSEIYSVGLGLYGSTVIDAARGFRLRSYTSTELNAIANAVNTAQKAAGKQVWNSTANKPVWAIGSTAGSVWVDGAGTTINTPV